MPRLRCHVAGVLGAVAFVAVGFAALREADEVWDGWLFSLTLGLLLTAVLLAARRGGDRRGFWVGFALFGWGYLILALIPATGPRLITTRALTLLHQSDVFAGRAHRMRAIVDLDRLQAHGLSPDDVRVALRPTGLVPGPGDFAEGVAELSVPPARPGAATQPVECVLTWATRQGRTGRYEDIILKASPDGDLVRLKDVARVEMGPSFHAPGARPGSAEVFLPIGHTLFAWPAAWLGGLLARRIIP